MRSYLLVLRFATFNVAALALLVVVWLEGWVGLVIESDITRITSGIAVVFVIDDVEPDGPSKVMNSPLRTSRSTSSRA